MPSLPFSQKREIQESFLKFKELRAEIRKCEQQIVLSNVAKWGGLACYVLSFVPKGTFAGMAGAAGLVGLIGWYWGYECRKDHKNLRSREELITNPLRGVGVLLLDHSGKVGVFVNSDVGLEEVWPFNDENYQ